MTPVLLHRLGRDALHDRLLIAQLLHVPDERDHDLGHDLLPFLLQLAGRRDDRLGLHLGDLGIGDPETHAAMAEHRVELVELLDAVQQRLLLRELAAALAARFELGDLDHQVFALGQELVQRRIDRPDRHRRAVHRLEHAVEVVALERQQLVERLAAIGFVVGQDHLLDDRDAAFAEEHVLGAAQADAARAERVGELGLIRQVGVGADAERPHLVGPVRICVEALVDVRLLRLHLAGDDLQDLARLGRDLADLDLAGEAVERHPVAFLDRLAGDGEAPGLLVDVQRAGADDRRLAHLAADDGGV